MRPRGPERPCHVPSAAGFSLLELLIALVIIGIMVMTVAPSLQQVLGDNRQTTAAGDLVRIGRRARGLAIETGAAHLLRYREAAPSNSNLGQIELYAGMTSKCLQTNWVQAMADFPPVGIFDMIDYNPTNGATLPTAADAGRQVITLRARTISGATATARTLLRLCFQPNGDVYSTASDATDAALVMQRDRVQFSIRRTIDGVNYGAERRVLFPTAGSMRFE